MEQTEHEFIQILKERLSERCRKNSGYSLRAFARDLEISPQRLSHILNGRHGLSPEAALSITKKLGMNESEAAYFCALVEQKHARSALVKQEAKKKLKDIKTVYKDLSSDHFKIISDWYHFAIMELTLIEGFSSEPKWIAKTLGITVLETNIAIKRLLKLEMMEKKKNGTLILSGQFFYGDPKGVPSQALRQFHQQLMMKSIQAMEFQNFDQRDFSSTVLALDEDEIPLAKKKMKEFRESFDRQFSGSKKKTKVYCLGMQFFNLQESL